MGRTGLFQKWDSKGVWRPVDPPRKLADMMLASVRTSPEITAWNRLKKISLTPVLLRSGEIVMEHGYDAGAQVYIDSRGFRFTDPAAKHPRLSATACKKLIEENVYPFVCKYEFVREREESLWHETGAFAAVLSAAMSLDDRLNLPSVPMHCVSAPSQACGKTRLVEAISVLVTGTRPTVVTYDGMEEFSKYLPVMLARGDLGICIDNINGTLNNPKLAALLTQEYTFSNRILGKSEDVTFENLSVLFATGVNLQLSGDLPSRCLMIRVEPESERPEAKWFPFH